MLPLFLGLLNVSVMTARTARGPCVLQNYGPAIKVRNHSKKKHQQVITSWWEKPYTFNVAGANRIYIDGARYNYSFPYRQVGSSYSCMWVKEAPKNFVPDWESEGKVQEYEGSPMLPFGVALIVVDCLYVLVLGTTIFLLRRGKFRRFPKKGLWAWRFLCFSIYMTMLGLFVHSTTLYVWAGEYKLL